jgi:hypothetical protein
VSSPLSRERQYRLFFFSPVTTGEKGEAAGRTQRGRVPSPP